MKKIIIAIVAVLIIGVVIYFIQRGPTVEAYEYPENVKWDTDLDTAKTIFDNKEGYTRVQTANNIEDSMNVVMYEVDNYLGIDGLDGELLLKFDNDNQLIWGYYKFSVKGTGSDNGTIATKEAIVQAKKGLIRANNKLYGKATKEENSDESYCWKNSITDLDIIYNDEESINIMYKKIDTLNTIQ